MAVMNRPQPYFIAMCVFNINLNLILIIEMIESILDRFILCSAVRRALEPLLCWQQLLVLSGLKTCFEAEISSMTEKVFRSVLPG